MTGDNHLTYLPSDWTYDRLKDIVLLRNEKVKVESEEENYLELEDIEGGIGKIISRRNTMDVESAVTKFDAGDVLFGKLRPYLEKYCHPNFDGYCTGEILAFEPTNIHDRFLFYSIGADWLIKTCSAVAYGAKMPRVSWTKQLGLLEMPLPPVPEQEMIADYLDVSCEAIDRAVEAKQKQLETLDTLRKSIITPAVMTGLNPNCEFQKVNSDWIECLPVGWKLKSLKRVSETQTGITLGKTYEGELVERPYLRAANVQDGYLDLEKITKIQLPAGLASRYELQVGDVLMTEGGDLDKLGRGFPWQGQIAGCLHQNHVFAIRTNRRHLLPEFLSYLTASSFGRDYFEATGKRTTNLACTNGTKVGLLPVPLPSIEEQEDIVEYLNKELGQTAEIENLISDQITTLKDFRKSLIHECVTGKRRLTEADVEKVKRHV